MTTLYNLFSQKRRRQSLRKQNIGAEKILWSRIKNKQINYKFRRQFGIGNYIVDFYCPQLKLAIEIDGATHSTLREIERDEIREKYLKNLGITVRRYTNIDVRNNLLGVIDDICNICAELNLERPLLNPLLIKRR